MHNTRYRNRYSHFLHCLSSSKNHIFDACMCACVLIVVFTNLCHQLRQGAQCSLLHTADNQLNALSRVNKEIRSLHYRFCKEEAKKGKQSVPTRRSEFIADTFFFISVSLLRNLYSLPKLLF